MKTKTPEETVDDCIKELIDRNIVAVVRKRSDGRTKSVRVPRFLYGLCLFKAAEMNLFHLHRNTAPNSPSSIMGKVRRLADHSQIKTYPSSEPYINHLRSFISFDFREGYVPGEELGGFLTKALSVRGIRFLRVLDLERVFKPKLPENLGDLIHLRYLGLRWTYSDILPASVGNLWELQILDVKHTYIPVFPHSIWEMRQLRHLYLNEGHRSRFVHHPRGGSLANLQTLWGLFVDKDSRVRKGLDTLTNLKKLGLTCQLNSDHSQMKEAVAEWISKLDRLQSLRLRSRDERGEPSDLISKTFSGHPYLRDLYLSGRLQKLFEVDELPPRLTNLHLSLSRLTEDPMDKLEKHGYLVYLRFLANSFVGRKMICKSGGFPQLLVLKVWKLEELEEWEVEQGALPSLVELEIRSCTKLKRLPDGLQHVRTLKKLKLTYMPDEFVASVRAIQRDDWSIEVESRPETRAGPSSSS